MSDNLTFTDYFLIDEFGNPLPETYAPQYTTSTEKSFHELCTLHAPFQNDFFDTAYSANTPAERYDTFCTLRDLKVSALQNETSDLLTLYHARQMVEQSPDMIFQKIIAPYSGIDSILTYLSKRKMIEGFIARFQDTHHLRSPQALILELGLDYHLRNGKPGPFFKLDDLGEPIGFVDTVYALRFEAQSADNPEIYRTPYGGENEQEKDCWKNISPQIWTRWDPEPFKGNGFTKSCTFTLPEFCIEEPIQEESIPNDAELYEMTANGEELVAVYKKGYDFLRVQKRR